MDQRFPPSDDVPLGVFPKGQTIFIVEDDDAARHSLVASLEAMGCAVKTFADCESFLAVVEQLGPGCLLLDFHFEGLSGLGLLERLHEMEIFIPTALFTGRFGALLKKRAIDYPEVVAVLEKPLDARPLIEALQKASALFKFGQRN